ncbi:NAD-dependent succinate-semialdehyde dehydrogenase [Suttonella sp. R2A3]|uniref:NAD-dependent succinate-semialdehyde dehydrogenase n=1 Tax=Suttonella sp. R2A3 TaxID=2908648 RepID=UPI001F15B540|nr:NAD-dependent succinate-semialdehyde dehydrogenase [Suttonella sp. R2A3]UJF23777.1 NAD-dependent succinate-semialdehyde dehydrogenase [Suttonella sp. R2A3]
MSLRVINPSNGQLLHEYPTLDDATIEERISRAHSAYQQWKQTSFAERGALLKHVAKLMREDRERLALLMTDEMGKPINEARGEVDKAAWCAEHYADHAEDYLARETIASDAALSYVQYLPIGVVLGILPWNAPFWLALRFSAPALMAGNTCVMKHDPHTPACSVAIAELFVQASRECGAPADLLLDLPLENAAVAGVIADDRVQAVSFTGSSAAGSKVASMAAEAIKPAVLELGGSDPCIALKDANLEKAADVITLSRIINAGQSCIAAKRILVDKAVYPELLDKLKTRLAALKMGDPREEDTRIGPIARADLRDNLHRQVQKSVEAGAKLILGGELPEGDGFFYPATLLADVSPEMTAACEETFGPVMVVMPVADADEALRIANDTPYGLAASVWGDRDTAEAMAAKIEAGQVSINGIVKTDPRLPSGGIKRSGYGRELGPHGIKMFVNAQQVWISE